MDLKKSPPIAEPKVCCNLIANPPSSHHRRPPLKKHIVHNPQHKGVVETFNINNNARIVALDRQQTTFSPEYDRTASQVPINPSTRIHERLPLTFHHHHHCLIVPSGHIN
ncbi:hypothetical protein ACLB2K_019859 [Fragaria x ananassa]